MSAQTQTPSSATSASHPYTCNTCQVAYRNIDLQKAHMKSDWHRYNLKRRVASLPPIAADVFTEKVLQARAASTAEADKALFERACEACQKTYYSENAYQNHILSQKHKANELASAKRSSDETTSVVSSTFSLGEPVPIRRASIDSAAEEEFTHVVESLQSSGEQAQRPSPVKRPSNPQAGPQITNDDGSTTEDTNMEEHSEATTPVQKELDLKARLKSCIFCNYSSPTLPLNASHMERFHGMFIPEKSYLVDLEGLIYYLHRKVQEYHQCLYCDKFKTTAFGAQTHMRDKGHCKIPFSTEDEQLEIGAYYDFRSTYSDSESSEDEDEDDEDEGTHKSKLAKLGARRAAQGAGEESEDEDGEGWETDSSASSLDSADLTAVPAEGHLHQFERLGKHPHHSRRDPRNRHRADGWHSHAHKHTHAVFYDDYEMHLPSGRSVGHRSLNKYYRQNLNNYPTAEERLERQAIEGPEADDQNKDRSVISRDAAGMAGVSLQRRREAKQVEDRSRKLEDFHAKRNEYKYGKKLNNQKSYYYRYQRGG